MATTNPFDLLGDDDNDDPSQLIAAQQKLAPPPKKSPPPAASAQPAKPAKLPSKPLPPAEAARESKTEGQRGGGRAGGRGIGRGRGFNRDSADGRGFNRDSSDGRGFNRDSSDGRGFNRDSSDGRGFNRDSSDERGFNRGSSDGRGFNRDSSDGRAFNRDSADNENAFGSNNGFSGGYRPPEDGDAEKTSERRGYGGPRGGYRGGRRGGFSNGEVAEGERPRRQFERRSGTGRGNEPKRDGAGRGNWGTPSDEVAPEAEETVNESEKNVDAEKPVVQEDVGDANKENPVNEPVEKEPEEMTLEEYEKVLEEKRKALLALKTEERKVGLDKDFESMQLLSSKKSDEDIFVKLGSEKDKRKEAAEKEEKAKKSVTINEFLKPAEGERYYSPGSRGRGRGRGPRGGSSGGFSGTNMMNNVAAPSIEDVGQFPSLGAK